MNNAKKSNAFNVLLEKFGEPIGKTHTGVGVSDQRQDDMDEVSTCEGCGSMLELDCETCSECGMMPGYMEEVDDSVGEADKRKGPTKKTAKSWVKGIKTFKGKVAKAKRAGVDDPAAFAAWMTHKATGKWPSEE